MKRILVSLLIASSLAAAPGDISGAAINEDGWQLWLWIDGAATNGTYATGIGVTNRSVGFSVVELGNEKARLSNDLWATHRIRFPWPNHAYADNVVEDGRLRIKLALNRMVYQSETNLTVDVLSGLYTAGGVVSGAASGITVTNNSQAFYQPPVANWSWPEHRVVNGPNLTLRAVGFGHGATNGHPLALMRFVTTDSAGVSRTNNITQMSIRQGTDARPSGEYIADIDTSLLAPGPVVSYFQAYSWLGNTLLDSRDEATQWPTGEPRQITNWVHFPQVRAVVSSAGNDSTGLAAAESYWSTNQSPAEFATIGGALRAIYGTNNATYSRGHYGGGIIYLKAGNHLTLGSTVTAENVGNTAPPMPLTITRHPNASRAQVVITGKSADTRAMDGQDMFHIKDVSIDTIDSALWTRCSHLWFEDVHIINATALSLATNTDVPGGTLWFTGCLVGNLAQGLKQYSSQHQYPNIRGNMIVGNVGRVTGYLVMGNEKGLGSSTTCILADRSGGVTWPLGKPIIYNNAWYAIGFRGNNYDVGNNGNMNGLAFVQNLFENIQPDSTPTTYMLGSTSGLNLTNFIVWNNVILGARNLVAYATSGDDPSYRSYWDVRNNVWDQLAMKSDPYTGSGGASSTRIGNWPALWSVGWSGNVFLKFAGHPPAVAFEQEVQGLNGYITGDDPIYTNFAGWVRPAMQDFTTSEWADGFGDYHFSESSLIPGWTTSSHLLPFDLAGAVRSAIDPPGAFAVLGAVIDPGDPENPYDPDPPTPPAPPHDFVILESHILSIGTIEQP